MIPGRGMYSQFSGARERGLPMILFVDRGIDLKPAFLEGCNVIETIETEPCGRALFGQPRCPACEASVMAFIERECMRLAAEGKIEPPSGFQSHGLQVCEVFVGLIDISWLRAFYAEKEALSP